MSRRRRRTNEKEEEEEVVVGVLVGSMMGCVTHSVKHAKAAYCKGLRGLRDCSDW